MLKSTNSKYEPTRRAKIPALPLIHPQIHDATCIIPNNVLMMILTPNNVLMMILTPNNVLMMILTPNNVLTTISEQEHNSVIDSGDQY